MVLKLHPGQLPDEEPLAPEKDPALDPPNLELPLPAPAKRGGRPKVGEPWVKEGISRALWYRREARKKGQ